MQVPFTPMIVITDVVIDTIAKNTPYNFLSFNNMYPRPKVY